MQLNRNNPQDGPLVSVVIPSPADPERAPECVRAVLDQTWSNREIVLVCDADTEVSVPPDEPVRVVSESRGDNLARLINRGIRAADGEIVVVLMPNCLPASVRWMEELIRPFEDSDVGAVVSQCVAHDTRELNLPARLMESVESPELTAEGEPTDLHLLSHLCDALRADLLRDVDHVYDPSIKTPGEAVDLSLRMGTTGKRILLSPTASVLYRDPPTTRTLGSVLGKALEYGRADAVLGKAYNIDWLGSRTFAAAALSLALIPIAFFNRPVAVIAAGLLFAWGWFLPLRLPVIRWEWPVSVLNVAVYAAIVLSIRDHWAPGLFPPRRWHPAIIRQWCLLAGMTGSYLLLLAYSGATSAVRGIKDRRGLVTSPAILVLGTIWYLLSGIGYLLGYLADRGPETSDEA